MKQILLSTIALTFVYMSSAQVPQAFSFQSLVLEESGDPIRETEIGVQIQILEGDATGRVLYNENHTPTTNSNGLYSIEIGNGDNASSSFADIDWLSGEKFISLSHDTDGGTDYRLVGSSQLLSVPYALAAGTSFIAPKIYVSNRSRANLDPTTFDISEFDARENISYFYEWIQGNPEDVYIEYSNLPDNMNIQHGSRSVGYTVVSSMIDTIVDGIIRPNSSFGYIDPNIQFTPGSYLIDMTFRTDSEVLAEIKYPIEIIDPIIEVVDCAADYEGERIVTSVCSELSTLMETEIQIEKIDEQNIIVNNFLNANTTLEIRFRNDECVELDIINPPALSIGQFTLEEIDVIGSNGNLEFRMILTDQDGEGLDCEIIYGI